MGFHFLLQEIFLTQGLNPGLLLGRWIIYQWATWEAQIIHTHTHTHTHSNMLNTDAKYEKKYQGTGIVNDGSHQLHHVYCCEQIFLKFRGWKQKHVLVAHNSGAWAGLSCMVLLALQEMAHFIQQASWLRAGFSWITGLFSLSVWDAFELWCWRRLLKSSLYSKKIKLVNPKGNQSWIFIGRTDSEAEAPMLWSPEERSQLTGKDPDAGKDWRQVEKGMPED